MAPALVAHADTPLSLFSAFGDKARSILNLNYALLTVSVVVIVVIGVLIGTGLARPRHRFRDGGPGVWPVSRPPGGLGWIYVGVAVTALTLLGSLVWSMAVIAHVAAPRSAPALTIDVTGHQWWWEVRYSATIQSRQFATANEIHIPVGLPVHLRLRSADVIHSFWVPALSGKTDLIPGQVNETWIEASEPGSYRGQCAEYCGLQHAHMAFSVIADPPEAFDAWWNAQLQPSPMPTDAPAVAGGQTFVRRCGACHAVRGTMAGGIYGPDLTHLARRTSLAAGTLPNTPGHLAAWIADPQGQKPGNKMPPLDLSGPELASIQAYLATLK
jgi:cytochrome c oxidase subunit 2